MAFCTSCGADVTGKNFCVGCGKPVGSGQPASSPAAQPPPAAPVQPASYSAPPQAPPAQPPVYAAPPPPGPPGAPIPKKGVSPVVWVLVGIFGFFLLVGLVITIGVGMFVHKVKQNPALAAAKLLTIGNPDVEVVDANERNNKVTLRDKKTGETITMDFDDLKKGKLVLRGGKGETATIQAQGSGQSGTLEIKSPDGSMKFGAGAGADKVPDWVPAYPGVTPQVSFSMQAAGAGGGTFQFTTKDAPASVLSFYEKGLQQAGFKITANVTGNSGSSSGGMISGEDEATKRTMIVTVGADNGATGVNVIFGTKK